MRVTRILIPTLLAAGLLLAPLAGCRRKPRPNAAATIEESDELQPRIEMGDPRAAAQLLRGFYPIENGSWRWTMQKFAVSLASPKGAGTKGAELQVRMALPGALLQKLKTVTLTAIINGVTLPSQSFDKPGDAIYKVDVPADLLKSEAVTVEFALDKALAPGELDARELGMVCSSILLEAK